MANKQYELQSSFNSGQWSPRLLGQVLQKKYRDACQHLENWIVYPHGPAHTRPGFEFVAIAGGAGSGAIYLPWNSCPQAVVFGGDGNPWFVTCDNATPTSTLRFMEYVNGTWSIFYSVTEPNPNTGVNLNWYEPVINIINKGAITVAGLVHPDSSGNVVFDIFTFNGTYLLNRTEIPIGSPTFFELGTWVLLDSSGVIHVLVEIYDPSPVSFTWVDYRSTDNGATFTPVTILTGSSTLSVSAFITEDSGTLWAYVNGDIFKSLDFGLTWTDIGTAGLTTLLGPQAFAVYGGLFLTVIEDTLTGSILIKSSSDSLTWTTRETIAYSGHRIISAAITYDGTYYYAAINLLYFYPGPAPCLIYRSSDGLSWSLISTINMDDGQGYDPTFSNKNGQLIYTNYYASTFLGNPANSVYMLTMWISSDHGVTWTAIQTPYYDLTTGAAP